MKVLIVEDCNNNQSTLKNLLQAHDCAIATEIQKALEFARHGSFDLIVLDLMVNRGIGTELLDGLQKNRVSTPVIALSSDRGILNQRRCERFGVYAFLRKPIVDDQAFLHIIDTLDKNKTSLPRERQNLPAEHATVAVQTSLGAPAPAAPQKSIQEPTTPPLWMQINEARNASNN